MEIGFILDMKFTSAPNKPDAVNLAMAFRYAIEDQWRPFTDLERWATLSAWRNLPTDIR